MIYAYGDDGSDERKKRVVAVSIIAGYEEWWQQLEDEWTIRCNGIPFHATDCESDKGDYKNIPHEENKATYRDLTGILAASRVGGLGIAIDLTAEKEVFPNAPPIAYYKAFLHCLEHLVNVAENINEVCEVTYDIGPENEYHAASLYAWLRENDDRFCRLMHPKISFAPWRESARLQAADLLAFEAWKALDHTVGPIRRERKSWDLLKATNRFEAIAYGKEWFEGLKNDLPELEKRVGFNESDYLQWLGQQDFKHNMSNLISFIRSRNNEFQKFDHVATEILKMPHAEIKAKLDAEKKEKTQRKKEKTDAIKGKMD
ncbi:MAG TPA: hypothetical protein VL128_16200 [Candidatus Eisenbacteria bacterium]|nr:hypothetical protein [Candidatus Eisenbacteria bacterium]